MAEKITVDVPHRHTRLEARSRIEGGFAKVSGQITGKGVAFEQQWDGDTMDFAAGVMGQKITGHLAVHDDHVTIEVDLPWMLKALSAGIEDKLKKGTTLLLEKK